jgi:hypothetical protein
VKATLKDYSLVLLQQKDLWIRIIIKNIWTSYYMYLTLQLGTIWSGKCILVQYSLVITIQAGYRNYIDTDGVAVADVCQFSEYCRNNGTCSFFSQKAVCDCGENYRGETCGERISKSSSTHFNAF